MGQAMTAPDLGPLPEDPVAWFRAPYGTLETNPLFRVSGPQSLQWAVACFTEDQMRAYALQEVAKERERCAKLCEDLEARVWRTYKNGGAANQHTEGRSDGAGECAALIREEKA
jgi:hypothetical protein